MTPDHSLLKSGLSGSRRLKILLKYLIGFVILFCIGISIDLNTAIHQLATVSFAKIFITCMAALALQFSQTLRLHALLVPYVQSFWTTLRLCFVSTFFNNFLPGGMGGDVYKIAFLRRTEASITDALIFIALDRLSGLFFFVAASAILLFCNPSYVELVLIRGLSPSLRGISIVVLPVAVGLLLFFLMFRRKVQGFIRDAIKTIASLSRGRTLLFALFSFVTFFVRTAQVYLVVVIFVPSFHWQYVVLLNLIVYTVAMAPVSVGSLGVMEGMMIFALTRFGVPTDLGASIAIVYRLAVLFVSCCGLAVWLSCKEDPCRS